MCNLYSFIVHYKNNNFINFNNFTDAAYLYAAFQATRNPCFSNLLPVKVHWNGSQTHDFPPVNSY